MVNLLEAKSFSMGSPNIGGGDFDNVGRIFLIDKVELFHGRTPFERGRWKKSEKTKKRKIKMECLFFEKREKDIPSRILGASEGREREN